MGGGGAQGNVIGAIWGSSQPEQGPNGVSKAETKGRGKGLQLLHGESVPQTTPRHLSSEQTLSWFWSAGLEHLRGVLLERAFECVLPFHHIMQARHAKPSWILSQNGNSGMKKTPMLSKGVRAWFMALCPTNASLVGRFRVSGRRRLFWNLLNFSEPEGLKESLILFSWCLLWQSPSKIFASQEKQGFSLSASVQDTNSSMLLLRLGQGWLGGPVTAKVICQACDSLTVQWPHLCNNLSRQRARGDVAVLYAECMAAPRPWLYRPDRETPSRTRALAQHKHFLEAGLSTHASHCTLLLYDRLDWESRVPENIHTPPPTH